MHHQSKPRTLTQSLLAAVGQHHVCRQLGFKVIEDQTVPKYFGKSWLPPSTTAAIVGKEGIIDLMEQSGSFGQRGGGGVVLPSPSPLPSSRGRAVVLARPRGVRGPGQEVRKTLSDGCSTMVYRAIVDRMGLDG